MEDILHRFADIHTHCMGRKDAVYSLPYTEYAALSVRRELTAYSLELHPWKIMDRREGDVFRQVCSEAASDTRFVAVGECGLDKRHGAAWEIQLSAFIAAIEAAREVERPLIIHCVGAWSELIGLARRYGAHYERWPWVVHGYRKGLPLAQQLVAAGLSISLGARFDPAVALAFPQSIIYRETDEEERTSHTND